MDKRVLRTGAWVIAGAILLRLLGGIPAGAVTKVLTGPELASLVIFLQTGRLVRPAEPLRQSAPPTASEEIVPEQTSPEITPVNFSGQDAQLVTVNSSCGYKADIPAALEKTLEWDLTENGPAVLILHTHGTEAYAENAGYRSDDTAVNVVGIGDRIAELLEAGGIGVVHDRTLHDKPSYNGSYNHARAAIEENLARYPSVRLVLDIHRDAAEDASGKQIDYVVSTERGQAAKLMLVVGTDAGGWEHPNWQENLALAVKLHALLERNTPGICRSINFRSSRFNQDLSPGALLVEVGAAGNTREEAVLSAELLAESILEISHGTRTS